MKTFLTTICMAVLAVMLYLTISASLQQDIITGTRLLWPDLWFQATLADAYFGFLFFYLWLCYRETGLIARLFWFALIMAFGNIAMASYVLLQVRAMQPGDSIESIMLRRRGHQP